MIAKRQAAALPHTGIATFCKAPYVFEPAEMNADVAVLGIPFDNMASMRPGCRQAPRALRDASTRFGWLGDAAGSSGYFDIGQNATLLSGVRIVDAGDVDVRLDAAVSCDDERRPQLGPIRVCIVSDYIHPGSIAKKGRNSKSTVNIR